MSNPLLTVDLAQPVSELERASLVQHAYDHLNRCYSIFDPVLNQTENQSAQFLSNETHSRIKTLICSNMELLIRIGAVTASYTSVIPFVPAAIQAFSNPIWQKVFASGEVAAWGTFFAWSSMNVIDGIKQDRKIDRDFTSVERRGSSQIYLIYWTGLITLGLCSQLPSAYLTYHYNQGNLFWTVFAPAVYSSFAIYSLDAFVQKISHTDNWVNRHLSKEKDKMPILRAGENFCLLLEECLLALLEHSSLEHSSSARDDILRMFTQPQSTQSYKKNFFLKLLDEGFQHRLKKLQTEKIWLKKGEQYVGLSGAFLSLSRSVFQSILVYKGSQLILRNDYFSAFIIMLAIAPTMYLEIDINRQMYSDVFRRSATFCSQIKSCFYQRHTFEFPLKIFKYVPAYMITAFGMGSLTTGLEENIGFETPNIILSTAVMGTIYLLIANSLMSFTDLIEKKIKDSISSADQKQVSSLAKSIQFLIANIQRMPKKDIEMLIHDLEKEAIDHSSIFKALSDPNFKNMLDRIDPDVFKVTE